MKISVYGLGKLGCAMAAVFAAKEHTVIGVDVDPNVVERLEHGEAPVEEPGLDELIARVHARLSATTDGQAAAAASDISVVIVPTPSDESGSFSLDILLTAAETIGRGIAARAEYHTVVVSSTVLPGAMDGAIVPALERASGKRCGADFGVVYSPEFVALGNVIRDMLRPDIVLIGERDSRAGDAVEALYRSVVENEPAIQRMNMVNAEVTKLAVNTFVTAKISFANMLAEICERLPNADAHVVTTAIGSDSRIGAKFIRPGAAYGGPCFPRDNKALSHLAETLGTRALIAEATDELNRRQNARLADLAVGRLPPGGGRVGILGMAYKPDAAISEESAGLHLARELARRAVPVTAYDPLALEHARQALGDSVAYAASAQACVSESDVVVLATPWAEFVGLNYGCGARKRVIIDCWRVIDGSAFTSDGAELVSLGCDG